LTRVRNPYEYWYLNSIR